MAAEYPLETHRRWVERLGLNRDTSDAAYPDAWYFEQCGQCRFWLAVDGPLGGDWGACSGAASAFDGTLRFEHDGCEGFQLADEDGPPG
jgi:hypothetical protein